VSDHTSLITVKECAERLGFSECWVRRHLAELPVVRLGRAVRFDAALLSEQIRENIPSGRSLKPERKPMLSRFQRGYVYQTGSKVKTWYARYREDVPQPDGKIVRRTRNVRLGARTELSTKTAAENKLLDLLRSSNPSVEMIFSELVTRWQDLTLPEMKSSTADYYKKVLRAYVVPEFGRQKISAITRNDVQKFLVERSKTYSRSSVHGMKIALSLVMGWAVDNEWIKKNPTIRLKSPREENCGGKRVVRNKELNGDQVEAIAKRLQEPYSTLVWFLAVTGLRIGEAVAIRWSDFKGDVLHVQRRIYEGEVNTPKSDDSVRRLPIPEELVQRLKSLETKGWIFQARNGSPLNQGNALKRYLRPVVEELGITLGGWHDFRHSQSTVMRLEGVPREVRAAILGHSVKQTDDYGEINAAEFQRPLADVAGALLRSVTKTAEAA
jgi:integrase